MPLQTIRHCKEILQNPWRKKPLWLGLQQGYLPLQVGICGWLYLRGGGLAQDYGRRKNTPEKIRFLGRFGTQLPYRPTVLVV